MNLGLYRHLIQKTSTDLLQSSLFLSVFSGFIFFIFLQHEEPQKNTFNTLILKNYKHKSDFIKLSFYP